MRGEAHLLARKPGAHPERRAADAAQQEPHVLGLGSGVPVALQDAGARGGETNGHSPVASAVAVLPGRRGQSRASAVPPARPGCADPFVPRVEERPDGCAQHSVRLERHDVARADVGVQLGTGPEPRAVRGCE